jgi:hypothetical protein
MQRFEGLGITADQLRPNTAVMVAVGRLVANINGQPCLIAWAIVRGPVAENTDPTDPAGMWWLDVYSVPGGPPLPQQYRADEILGVPALGLTMDGAPPVTVHLT